MQRNINYIHGIIMEAINVENMLVFSGTVCI